MSGFLICLFIAITLIIVPILIAVIFDPYDDEPLCFTSIVGVIFLFITLVFVGLSSSGKTEEYLLTRNQCEVVVSSHDVRVWAGPNYECFTDKYDCSLAEKATHFKLVHYYNNYGCVNYTHLIPIIKGAK